MKWRGGGLSLTHGTADQFLKGSQHYTNTGPEPEHTHTHTLSSSVSAAGEKLHWSSSAPAAAWLAACSCSSRLLLDFSRTSLPEGLIRLINSVRDHFIILHLRLFAAVTCRIVFCSLSCSWFPDVKEAEEFFLCGGLRLSNGAPEVRQHDLLLLSSRMFNIHVWL